MANGDVNKDKDKLQAAPLPKNAFELTGEIIRTLGKYAKIVLIVGGLMGGGFFAFYKYNDQYKKGQNEYQERVERLFDKITSFSEQQITTVDGMFTLQKKLKKAEDDSREMIVAANKKIEESEKMIEEAKRLSRAEIEEKQKESEELLKKEKQEFATIILQKEKHIEEKDKELKQKEEMIRIKTKELEKKYKELEEESKKLTMNTNEIFNLKQQRDILAKSILKAKKKHVGKEAYDIAIEIQDDYFPENKTNPIVNWLNDYANNPSSNTAKNLQEKLVGYDTGSLEMAIEIQNNLEIKTWFKLNVFDESNDEKIFYFGAKSPGKYGYNDIVFISTGSHSSEKTQLIPKIQFVNCGRFLRIISIPDPGNWYELHSYFLVSEFDDTDPVIEEVNVLVPGSRWGMKQFLSSIDFDVENTNVLPLGDSFDQKFDQISYSMLENEHPEFYEMLMTDSNEEFADSLNMLKKSKEFIPPGHDNKHLSKLPKELQESFTELLDSTVKKDEININKLLSDYDLAGEIAAIALKNDFRVVGVQPVYQDIQSQIQQMPIPSIEDQNPEANKYLIFARYQISVHGKDEGSVMYLFERSLSEFGWRLTEFNENYYGNEESR